MARVTRREVVAFVLGLLIGFAIAGLLLYAGVLLLGRGEAPLV